MKKQWVISLVVLIGLLALGFFPYTVGVIVNPGTYFTVETDDIYTNYSYSFETTDELTNWTLSYYDAFLLEWVNVTRSNTESECGLWSLRFQSHLGVDAMARHPVDVNGNDLNISYQVYPESNVNLFTHTLKIYYWNGTHNHTIDTIDLQPIEDIWTEFYANFSLDTYGWSSGAWIEFNAYATSDDPEEAGVMYFDCVDMSIYDSLLVQNYTVGHSMEFSQIKINDSWIQFNNTGFNITNQNDLSIILYYLNDDILGASEGEYVLNFSANTIYGDVSFAINGFIPNNRYMVYRNTSFFTSNVTNASGVLFFDNNEWSSWNFSIYNTTLPMVTTNSSTGVEETNATLWGYLVDDAGEKCTAWFEYGTNLSYGETISVNWTEGTYTGMSWDTSGQTTNNDMDITTDGTNIWIVDQTNTQVYKYQMDGTYTGTNWDTSGQSNNPFGITTNGTNIWIVDGGNNRVYKYQMDGTYTGVNWNTAATWANGITTDGTNIWIVDGGFGTKEVYKYQMDGTYTTEHWDTAASGNGNPRSITTDGNYIWITDLADDVVYKYQMDGTYIESWDTTGFGSSSPDGIETNSTYFWILDRSDDEVYLLWKDHVMNVETGESFSEEMEGLTPGQLYHYRAVANNSGGTAYGSDMMFLTKPNVTTVGYANTTNVIDINVSWVKADGANNTYVERNTVSSWNWGSGTLIYNNTGTYYMDNSTGEDPLDCDTTYYYRLWSWANWSGLQQWSDSSLLLSNTTIHVDPPYHGQRDYDSGTNTVNLTWTRGNYSNQELVVKRNDTYATSATQSGNWVRQNSTALYFNESVSAGGFYTVWSWNETDRIYSLTGENIVWGALHIGCFNESNMNQFITFNIQITNEEATQTYIAEGLSSWHYVSYDDIPTGDNTIFIFSADGYRTRTYYYDIDVNYLYNISGYLPPVEVPVPPSPLSECELRPYMDSKTVINPDVDIVITLTHTLDDIISVQLYNESLYGTYGGWKDVSNDNFSYTSATVTVNKSVLDDNTTMVRAQYYYEWCEGMINTLICQITVINEFDQPIPQARCTVKRLNPTTEEYVTIAIETTDGNGQCTLWLIPYINYYFEITRDGYEQSGSKFWTPTPQSYTKTFRINLIPPDVPVYVDPRDIITWNAWFLTNTSLRVSYSDSSGNTTSARIIIYENGTDEMYNVTFSANGYVVTWSSANHSMYDYKVRLWVYNHSDIGNWSDMIMLPRWMSDKELFAISLDIDIGSVLGENPLGYVNLLIFFFAMIFLLIPAKKHVGIGIMSMGAIVFFIQLFIGLPGLTLAQWSIIPFFILFGVLVEISKGKKEARI